MIFRGTVRSCHQISMLLSAGDDSPRKHVLEQTRCPIRRPNGSCRTLRKVTTEVGQGNSFNSWQRQRGSAAEVRCQLYVALDEAYINDSTFDELTGLASETANMIGGLMNYLRRSGVKGIKYKAPIS